MNSSDQGFIPWAIGTLKDTIPTGARAFHVDFWQDNTIDSNILSVTCEIWDGQSWKQYRMQRMIPTEVLISASWSLDPIRDQLIYCAQRLKDKVEEVAPENPPLTAGESMLAYLRKRLPEELVTDLQMRFMEFSGPVHSMKIVVECYIAVGDGRFYTDDIIVDAPPSGVLIQQALETLSIRIRKEVDMLLPINRKSQPAPAPNPEPPPSGPVTRSRLPHVEV